MGMDAEITEVASIDLRAGKVGMFSKIAEYRLRSMDNITQAEGRDPALIM